AHLGPHDVLAVVQHLLNARVDVVLQLRVLRLQVDEFDFHIHSGTQAVSSIEYAAPQLQVTLPSPRSCTPQLHIHPRCRAGTPSIKAYGGTSRFTTAPAPTKAYSPIVTPQTMVQFAPRL